MGVVKFNKTATKAQALASTAADKIFFPTDSYSIIMNKKTYGAGYESELQFGGNDITDNYGPIDASMVGALGANRFAGLNSNNVTTEISYDSGNSWEAIDFGNQCVASVFADGRRNDYNFRATRTDDEVTQKSNKLRVTINGGLYSQLLKFVLYISTSGSGAIAVDIEGKKWENTEYNHIKTSKLGGWGGYNVINLKPTPGAILFGLANANNPTHYERLRFTFYIPESNTIDTRYKGFRVYSIYAYGGMGWSTPSSLAGNGHLYKINPDTNGKLNAEFPNNVKAVSFEGKATSAEKASSLSPESGTTLLYPSRIVTENYSTVYAGTLTFAGTGYNGVLSNTTTIGTVYTSLMNVKKEGKRPLLTIYYSTFGYVDIPLTLEKKGNGDYSTDVFRGFAIATISNKRVVFDAYIASGSTESKCIINTQEFGNYIKPSTGIPESDLATAVKNKLHTDAQIETIAYNTILSNAQYLLAIKVGSNKPAVYGLQTNAQNILGLLSRPVILLISNDTSENICAIPLSINIMPDNELGELNIKKAKLSGFYTPIGRKDLNFVSIEFNSIDELQGAEVNITAIQQEGINLYSQIGSFY